MKTLTIFVYGISAALLLVGIVMMIMKSLLGNAVIFLTLGLLAVYQGWVILKLSKKLQDKNNNN